jgi:acyl-CoA reductase-like NAD-dependent aldehyde dehydrogenase
MDLRPRTLEGIQVSDIYRMTIDGRSTDAQSGATFEVRNPAENDEIVGLAPLGGREDVKAAVHAAAAAIFWHPPWGRDHDHVQSR